MVSENISMTYLVTEMLDEKQNIKKERKLEMLPGQLNKFKDAFTLGSMRKQHSRYPNEPNSGAHQKSQCESALI